MIVFDKHLLGGNKVKKLLMVSILMSVIFIIAPFFLFSFEVAPELESGSVLQQTNYYDSIDSDEGSYDDFYENKENEDINLSEEIYYYQSY
jgi:hypothetical protein